MGNVVDFRTRKEINPVLFEFQRAVEANTARNLPEPLSVLKGFEESMTDLAAKISGGGRVVGYAVVVDFYAPDGVERYLRYAGPLGPGHVPDMAESLILDYRT